MYPVSNTFLSSLRAGGYIRKTEADIYFNGHLVTTVPVVDGAVDVDRTADTRRQCSFTVADESFIPQFVNSPLAPYGAEVVINSGIDYGNGSFELCTLGTFRIEQVTWTEAAGGLPKVTGYDRSKALQDAKTLFPVDISGFDAFTMIVAGVVVIMTVPINFDPSLKSYRIPGGTTVDSDRWAADQDAVKAMGAEIYFDVHGNLVIAPVPGLTQAQINSTTPVWEVNVGPNGVLVDASRGVSRTGVYNAVAITGSSSKGAAPMGWAADTDPRSPTYWGPAKSLPGGPYVITPFGEVVLRENNNLCTTSAQCTVAAQARLRDVMGLARSLDFTSVWNPALQEGDVVRLTYLDGSQELHIIDKLHIPIGSSSDAMTASTRTLTYQFSAHT